MMRPKILCMVDLSLAPEALEIIREHADVDYLPQESHRLVELISDYDAFWGHIDLKVDKQVLNNAKRLKAINTSSTGTDHIDKDEAARRGIQILSIARDYRLLETFTATAECAWMLMLACHRKLRSATKSVLEGSWESKSYVGEQLSGRVLGVLGVGRLGKMTVEYGKAFGMKVLGCDLKPFSIPGVERVDFDTLLSASDAISIHIHMEKRNYHLFNDSTFAKMKDNIILVNTSRGDIIDESSLIKNLDSGKIAAFGADVIHDEWRNDISKSNLIQYAHNHENVVITPHIGGCTTKSIVDARIFSAKKLIHFLRTGEELTQ